MLLTRRSDSLKRHSGQVAFPGGRADPGETPVETALRETREEIGLRPPTSSAPSAWPTPTRPSPASPSPRWSPSCAPGFTLLRHEAEVAEIFETPFAFLMDPANHELRVMKSADGIERRFYAMPYEERTIWGATAGMVRGLYDRWFG